MESHKIHFPNHQPVTYRFSPHLYVGFLFLVLHSRLRPSSSSSSHLLLLQLAHTQLVHTQLAHTQLVHTQLVHTRLAHTQLLRTQLVHTQLVHFAWQARYLATSTVTLRGRRGTWWHPPSLCVAGVALMALGWLCGALGSQSLPFFSSSYLVIRSFNSFRSQEILINPSKSLQIPVNHYKIPLRSH